MLALILKNCISLDGEPLRYAWTGGTVGGGGGGMGKEEIS